jgi:dUTP pyrophosphatase
LQIYTGYFCGICVLISEFPCLPAGKCGKKSNRDITGNWYNLPSVAIFVDMPSIEIKIINHSINPLPEYATPGSSGMDIRASLEQPKTLQPLERALIPTGLFIELPEGYEAQIRPRSGLAIRQGITCLNSPGTVDSDYRGEIKIILINLSGEEQVIHPGDRIAQMIIQPVEKGILKEVNLLETTERNTGGFGHTGKQ